MKRNLSHIYGGPHLPRQNLLSHDKTYFPWQNLLFHGKTFFSTAKLTFHHGKTYARFRRRSTHVPNLINELRPAKERRLNQ